MTVLGVDNVFVEVGDLDEAVAFYGDGLGLPVARRFGTPPLVLLRLGDETPGLGLVATPSPRSGGQRLWLEVPDARETARQLTERGVALLGPPVAAATGWVVQVADPWGNVVGFTDYALRPELGRR